jgi:hypothetical protein
VSRQSWRLVTWLILVHDVVQACGAEGPWQELVDRLVVAGEDRLSSLSD